MNTHRLIVPLSLAAIAAPALAELGPEARPKVIYTPIVLSGQGVAGFGTFGSFPYHSFINDADDIVFFGSIIPNYPFPDGFFLTSPGSAPQLVAKVGRQLPGMAPGVSISTFDINYHRVNSAHQATFEAWLMG